MGRAAFPHRLLPRSKGGLFALESVRHCDTVILVEGLFRLGRAVAGRAFRNTTCALDAHLTPCQFQQLTDRSDRSIYIVFDQDEKRAGQQASRQLASCLTDAGVSVRMVALPPGHDPNRYWVAGATAAEFALRLQRARPL